MIIWRKFLLVTVLGLAITSCSYNVRNSGNDLLADIGIETIYVAPVVNNSYTSGINNVVYNELLRVIASKRQVRLTRTEENADAVLSGTIRTAEYATAARTTANALDSSGNPDISVATLYNATLHCSFELKKTRPDIIHKNRSETSSVPTGIAKKAWEGSFIRNKTFPAANQLGTPGTTSALINESEFQRALKDLASTMMDEVHESMLSLF